MTGNGHESRYKGEGERKEMMSHLLNMDREKSKGRGRGWDGMGRRDAKDWSGSGECSWVWGLTAADLLDLSVGRHGWRG